MLLLAFLFIIEATSAARTGYIEDGPYYEALGNSIEKTNIDFYDMDNKGATPAILTTIKRKSSRIKRYDEQGEVRTLSLEEVKEVKDALQDLFRGRKIDDEGATIQPVDPDYYDNAGDAKNATSPTRSGWEAADANLDLADATSAYHPIQRQNVNFTEVGYYTSPLGLRQKKPTKKTAKTSRTRRRRTRTTTQKYTGTYGKIDIPALLDIIANLTYDYESNITYLLNETLKDMSLPTCPIKIVYLTRSKEPPTTSTTTTTTPEPTTIYLNYTGDVMAKCFVCGLDQEGIPYNQWCGDAFSGDFIPLTPIDSSARGKLSIFRKYCKYYDSKKMVLNPDDPRSVFGRFTGGCAVRWMDLSGLYTQRTCRSRTHPVLGKHFASKRMAKLELALQHVDEGCIISPVASLVPMSRGISLYARFHACVCMKNWCNGAVQTRLWLPYLVVVSLAFRMYGLFV